MDHKVWQVGVVEREHTQNVLTKNYDFNMNRYVEQFCGCLFATENNGGSTLTFFKNSTMQKKSKCSHPKTMSLL